MAQVIHLYLVSLFAAACIIQRDNVQDGNERIPGLNLGWMWNAQYCSVEVNEEFLLASTPVNVLQESRSSETWGNVKIDKLNTQYTGLKFLGNLVEFEINVSQLQVCMLKKHCRRHRWFKGNKWLLLRCFTTWDYEGRGRHMSVSQ